MYIFSRFLFHTSYYRRLSRVPCAIGRPLLAIYFVYSSVCVSPNLLIYPSAPNSFTSKNTFFVFAIINGLILSLKLLKVDLKKKRVDLISYNLNTQYPLTHKSLKF